MSFWAAPCIGPEVSFFLHLKLKLHQTPDSFLRSVGVTGCARNRFPSFILKSIFFGPPFSEDGKCRPIRLIVFSTISPVTFCFFKVDGNTSMANSDSCPNLSLNCDSEKCTPPPVKHLEDCTYVSMMERLQRQRAFRTRANHKRKSKTFPPGVRKHFGLQRCNFGTAPPPRGACTCVLGKWITIG